jgi:methyl-accepting chemotaxis protein
MISQSSAVSKQLRPFPVALASIAMAVALLLGAVVLMGTLLIPHSWGAIAAIWLLSLLILGAGFWFAWGDLRWLEREWQALSQLSGQEALALAESTWPAGRGAERPLIAERAAFVTEMGDPRRERTGRAPNDFRAHLRIEASSGAAHVGTVTRFLSSVLLLLAVIGTFAGMKAALPELVQRIQQAGQPLQAPADGGLAADPFLQIGAALSPVADAFGANFLALLGSLALGIATYGAVAERRRLLHQLERVSERYLYPYVPVGATGDALERALAEVRLSADTVARVGAGIEGLQTSLGSFEATLRDAIDGLRGSFDQGMRQQSTEAQVRLDNTVGKVIVAMNDVASALGATAASYETVSSSLRERDTGMQQASYVLQAASTDIAESMADLSAALHALQGRTGGSAQSDGAATQRGAEAAVPGIRSL